MNRTIFHAMRSQVELLRQANRTQGLLVLAADTDNPNSDGAKGALLRNEVRRELRAQVRRHEVSVEKGGKIVKNRERTKYVTKVTATEKRMVPAADGMLEMRDVPSAIETKLEGLEKGVTDAQAIRLMHRQMRAWRKANNLRLTAE